MGDVYFKSWQTLLNCPPKRLYEMTLPSLQYPISTSQLLCLPQQLRLHHPMFYSLSCPSVAPLHSFGKFQLNSTPTPSLHPSGWTWLDKTHKIFTLNVWPYISSDTENHPETGHISPAFHCHNLHFQDDHSIPLPVFPDLQHSSLSPLLIFNLWPHLKKNK